MASGSGTALEEFVRSQWTGSIQALAGAAGLSVPVLYAWFRGDHDPSLGSLRRLGRILKVPVHRIVALIEGEEVLPPDIELRTSDDRLVRISIH